MRMRPSSGGRPYWKLLGEQMMPLCEIERLVRHFVAEFRRVVVEDDRRVVAQLGRLAIERIDRLGVGDVAWLDRWAPVVAAFEQPQRLQRAGRRNHIGRFDAFGRRRAQAKSPGRDGSRSRGRRSADAARHRAP